MQVNDRTRVDARIAAAFKVASDTTGTSFDRLARTAAQLSLSPVQAPSAEEASTP